MIAPRIQDERCRGRIASYPAQTATETALSLAGPDFRELGCLVGGGRSEDAAIGITDQTGHLCPAMPCRWNSQANLVVAMAAAATVGYPYPLRQRIGRGGNVCDAVDRERRSWTTFVLRRSYNGSFLGKTTAHKTNPTPSSKYRVVNKNRNIIEALALTLSVHRITSRPLGPNPQLLSASSCAFAKKRKNNPSRKK